MSTLTQLIVLTFIIHLIDTLAYSVRLNAVRSRQFALSTSLFNVFVLISRTANMLQGPLIGSLIGTSLILSIDPLEDIRKVILSSTAGTITAILLIPTFLKLFSIAVNKLEETGSVPTLIVQSLSANNIRRIAEKTTTPRLYMLASLRYREIPKRLLLLHILITGIYTVGVLAAFYSATLVPPEVRLSATASSGLINGVASILLTLFIDPMAALISDQTMRGDRPFEDLKALVILLLVTKVLGTLLGQLLFIPSAKIIASFYM